MVVGTITIVLKQGDITEEHVDAIVNAANSSLLGGGGVDGAIHRKGGPAILEACKHLRNEQQKNGQFIGCATGEAVITPAGKLTAKNIIHTVGPVWQGGTSNEEELLRHCYINSLRLAKKHNLHKLAFPAISTGAYGFPITKASRIALKAVLDFAAESSSITEVRFILFTSNDLDVYKMAMESMNLREKF